MDICSLKSPELILLEKLGLGSLALSRSASAQSYHGDYEKNTGHYKSSYDVELTIEFKFTYKDNASQPISIKMNFNGKAYGIPSAVPVFCQMVSYQFCTTEMIKSFWPESAFKSIVYPQNIDTLCTNIKTTLETEILRRRTEATQNIFRGEAHVQFNRAKIKIDAILRLMKSYAAIIGLRPEEIVQIRALPDAKKLETYFDNYLRDTTLATPLPVTHLKEDFTVTRNAIVSKFSVFDPSYFQSSFSDSLQFICINLQMARDMVPELATSHASAHKEEKHPDSDFSSAQKLSKLHAQNKAIFTQLAFVAEQLPASDFAKNPSYNEAIAQIKSGHELLQKLASCDHTKMTGQFRPLLRKLNGCAKDINRSLGLIRYQNLPVNPVAGDFAERLNRLSQRLGKLYANTTANQGIFSQTTGRSAALNNVNSEHEPPISIVGIPQVKAHC